jgi:hypothetical protein
MVELGVRELAGLRLDPSPFQREAIRIEPERFQERDVLLVSMVGIAGVPLNARRRSSASGALLRPWRDLLALGYTS